jgi:hypothetical protein
MRACWRPVLGLSPRNSGRNRSAVGIAAATPTYPLLEGYSAVEVCPNSYRAIHDCNPVQPGRRARRVGGAGIGRSGGASAETRRFRVCVTKPRALRKSRATWSWARRATTPRTTCSAPPPGVGWSSAVRRGDMSPWYFRSLSMFGVKELNCNCNGCDSGMAQAPDGLFLMCVPKWRGEVAARRHLTGTAAYAAEHRVHQGRGEHSAPLGP